MPTLVVLRRRHTFSADKAQFLHFIQRCENLIDDQYTLSEAVKAFDHVCGSNSADYQKFVEVLFNVAATKYPREDGTDNICVEGISESIAL